MDSSHSYGDSNISEQYHKQAFEWPQSIVDRIMVYLKKLNGGQNCDGKFDQMVDVGCGSGQSTRVFSSHFRSILGCDASKEQIQRAIVKNNLENIRYVVSEGETLPLGNETVDLLTCAGTFHYIDVKTGLKEFTRVLKPRGCVAIFAGSSNDLALDREFHETGGEFDTHIFRELYREPFKRFINKINHPTSRAYDGLVKIYQEISGYEKCKVQCEFDWCTTMERFKGYEKNMPANKLLEDSLAGNALPLETALQKLKELWKVEELAESDIHIRAKMIVHMIFIKKANYKDANIRS